jgi:hypothetical protein
MLYIYTNAVTLFVKKLKTQYKNVRKSLGIILLKSYINMHVKIAIYMSNSQIYLIL